MAHTPTTLHLKVDADSTPAVELAPRVKEAIRDVLAAAGLAGADELAGAAAVAVMSEILRARQATPAEAAIARVRALHREEYGSCAECTHEYGVTSPCNTIRALDEPAPDSTATKAASRWCTASITQQWGSSAGRTYRCIGLAGHYDAADAPDFRKGEEPEPGGWHYSAPQGTADRMVWADRADGATPHSTKES